MHRLEHVWCKVPPWVSLTAWSWSNAAFDAAGGAYARQQGAYPLRSWDPGNASGPLYASLRGWPGRRTRPSRSHNLYVTWPGRRHVASRGSAPRLTQINR